MRKTTFWHRFRIKNDLFTKTGSGQTQGKGTLEKGEAFCAGHTPSRSTTRCTSHSRARRRPSSSLGSSVRNTPFLLFLAPFSMLKWIILPRQARDKHRKSTQKERCVFSCRVVSRRDPPEESRRRCEKHASSFRANLYMKTIILPRQARDKHRKG